MSERLASETRAERHRRHMRAIVENAKQRQATALMHADGVINRYLDAHTARYPAHQRVLTIRFDPATGYYYLNGKAYMKSALEQAATFMYASAHERQMGNTDEG